MLIQDKGRGRRVLWNQKKTSHVIQRVGCVVLIFFRISYFFCMFFWCCMYVCMFLVLLFAWKEGEGGGKKKNKRRRLILISLGLLIHDILRYEREAIEGIGLVLGELRGFHDRIQSLLAGEDGVYVRDVCLGLDLRDELRRDLLVVQFLPVERLEEGMVLHITGILMGRSQSLIGITCQELVERRRKKERKMISNTSEEGGREREGDRTPVKSDCASGEI